MRGQVLPLKVRILWQAVCLKSSISPDVFNKRLAQTPCNQLVFQVGYNACACACMRARLLASVLLYVCSHPPPHTHTHSNTKDKPNYRRCHVISYRWGTRNSKYDTFQISRHSFTVGVDLVFRCVVRWSMI